MYVYKSRQTIFLIEGGFVYHSSICTTIQYIMFTIKTHLKNYKIVYKNSQILGQLLLVGDFNAWTSQLKDFCDSDISCINNAMDMSLLSNT